MDRNIDLLLIKTNMYNLKNWTLKKTNKAMFFLEGNVYGHRRFDDGDFVATSYISEATFYNSYFEVKTRESSYRMMYYDHEYEGNETDFYDLNAGDLDLLESGITEISGYVDRIKNETTEKYNRRISEYISRFPDNLDEGMMLVFDGSKTYVYDACIVKNSGETPKAKGKFNIHSGIYVDSVLCEVDGHEIGAYYCWNVEQIEFYHVPDEYGTLCFYNAGDKPLEIQIREEKIKVHSEEIILYRK